jgi:hypothetical protein
MQLDFQTLPGVWSGNWYLYGGMVFACSELAPMQVDAIQWGANGEHLELMVVYVSDRLGMVPLLEESHGWQWSTYGFVRVLVVPSLDEWYGWQVGVCAFVWEYGVPSLVERYGWH